jgi:hypothetical protein
MNKNSSNSSNPSNPVNTFETGVSRDSKINSLKQPTHTQFININSKYRNTSIYSLSSDFQVTLTDESKRVIEMEVTNVQIPALEYYMFSQDASNNYFWVCVAPTVTKTVPYKIVIPDGNYSIVDLVYQINNTFQFMANDVSLNQVDPYIALLKNVTFKMEPKNMKSFFEIDPTTNTYFSVIFYDLTMNIEVTETFGWQVGFLSPFYAYFNGDVSGNQMFSTGNIKSEMSAKIFENRICYLSLNDFQYNNNSNNIVMIYSNNVLDDYIVGKAIVPVVVAGRAYNFYGLHEWFGFPRKYNGPVNLKKIAVRLYNDKGKLVNLNGLDFTFTIKLVVAYDI